MDKPMRELVFQDTGMISVMQPVLCAQTKARGPCQSKAREYNARHLHQIGRFGSEPGSRMSSFSWNARWQSAWVVASDMQSRHTARTAWKSSSSSQKKSMTTSHCKMLPLVVPSCPCMQESTAVAASNVCAGSASANASTRSEAWSWRMASMTQQNWIADPLADTTTTIRHEIVLSRQHQDSLCRHDNTSTTSRTSYPAAHKARGATLQSPPRTPPGSVPSFGVTFGPQKWTTNHVPPQLGDMEPGPGIEAKSDPHSAGYGPQTMAPTIVVVKGCSTLHECSKPTWRARPPGASDSLSGYSCCVDNSA